MFFAGRLPRPPWETRARVLAMVKRIDRAPSNNYGEKFRFSTLQARFTTFIDLSDRCLRARAGGRSGPFAQPNPAEPAARRTLEDKILHVTTFSDPLRE